MEVVNWNLVNKHTRNAIIEFNKFMTIVMKILML